MAKISIPQNVAMQELEKGVGWFAINTSEWVARDGTWFFRKDVPWMTADWIPGNPVFRAEPDWEGSPEGFENRRKRQALVGAIRSYNGYIEVICFGNKPNGYIDLRIPRALVPND